MSSVLNQLPVSEVMSIKVYSVSPDEPIEHALNLMRAKHFGGLAVVENGKVAGIITRKDIHEIDISKRDRTHVRDVMKTQILTTTPDEKVSVALEKMAKLRIMRMPVISKTGALIGIITLTDIDRASKQLQNKTFTPALKGLKCSSCGAPLKLTLGNVATCEYCGQATPV